MEDERMKKLTPKKKKVDEDERMKKDKITLARVKCSKSQVSLPKMPDFMKPKKEELRWT